MVFPFEYSGARHPSHGRRCRQAVPAGNATHGPNENTHSENFEHGRITHIVIFETSVNGVRLDDAVRSLWWTPTNDDSVRGEDQRLDILRRFGDWNDLRVRCVGALPVLTTWVNGVLVAELDVAAITWPGFDAEAVLDVLGPRGHIAFEVHDNDPLLGEERWGVGAACRWRDVRLRDLSD